MIINSIDHFEGMSLLCPIAAFFSISDIKHIQAKMLDLYQEDDEEGGDDLPLIADLDGCSVYINNDGCPELCLSFRDEAGKAFTFFSVYQQEQHGLHSFFESPHEE